MQAINEQIAIKSTRRWRHVLRSYWTLCKVSFQERMEYRWNTLFYSMLALLPVLVGIFLWTSVFQNKGDAQAIKQITTYYLIAGFLGWRIAQYQWQFMFEIMEGRMAYSLLRPMSYPAKVFWYEVGGRSWSTLMTLPVFGFAAILLGENFLVPQEWWRWLVTILAFMIAYVLNFFITAALGLVTIWQNQPEGYFALYGFSSGALGGTMVPLALMPAGFGDVLQWLPFAYVYSLPTQIFLGLPLDKMAQGFAVQIGWLILSILFFRWLWGVAVRRHEVYEGGSH